MKKKVIASVLCAAMVMGTLAGCGSKETTSESTNKADTTEAESSSTSSDSSSDAEGKVIGISMPTKSLERWNRDGSYLQTEFEKMGYKVEITYSDNDSDQQVNDIQNMLADKVDALVVAAIDGDTLSTVLADAADQEVPVIAYDRLIMNTDAISYYVSFDNYTVGTLQGQYIVDELDLDNAGDKTYTLEITAGDPADNNATFFYNGAMDVLKPYIDKKVLDVKSGQIDFEEVATDEWDTPTAMDRMQNILASYYADGSQLDICLCSNDSTALGVAQAIESDYKGGNTPLITGQDGDEANLKNILDGKQAMTVYKAVANEAVATITLVDCIMHGDEPDGSMIDQAGWNFDCSYDTESYDNGNKVVPSYLLVPDVVTTDNYKEVLVDSGYYTEDSDGYLKAAN